MEGEFFVDEGRRKIKNIEEAFRQLDYAIKDFMEHYYRVRSKAMLSDATIKIYSSMVHIMADEHERETGIPADYWLTQSFQKAKKELGKKPGEEAKGK